MSSNSIVSGLTVLKPHLSTFFRKPAPTKHPDLHTLWLQKAVRPRSNLDSAVARRCLDLLGPLAWDQFPERNLQRNWGRSAIPYATFCAACLVKIDRGLSSMIDLRNFLGEQTVLAEMLGFSPTTLPTHRHFARLLHTTPSQAFQFLFQSSIRCLLDVLNPIVPNVGECVSLDTKHILPGLGERE